jgi:hypothetical protein
MTDFEKIELACDILEQAEVMQEYDDCLWIKVDRQDWQAFFDCEKTKQEV